MPVFRRFTADLSGAPVGTPRATASAFGGDTAIALQGLGRAGREVGQQLVQVAEMRDKREAQVQLAKLRAAASGKLDELKQKGEPITEEFGEFLNGQLQELQDGRTTTEGLSIVQRQGANLSAELMRVARHRDAELAGEIAQNDINEFLLAENEALKNTPEILPISLDEAEAHIENYDLTPQQKRAALLEMKQDMAVSAARGWIDLAPEVAEEKIRESSIGDLLGSDAEDRLVGEARQAVSNIQRQHEIERKEFERRKDMTRSSTMIDALTQVNPSDPEKQPLTIPDVEALAKEEFADGERVLTPTQVSQLYTKIEQRANGGGQTTSPEAYLQIVPNLDTMSQDDLIEMYMDPDVQLGPDKFEKWLKEISDGPDALSATRKNALKNAPQILGLFPGQERSIPAVGRLGLFLDDKVREREEAYREAGKDPIEYYQDGTYIKDLEMIAERVGVLSQQQILIQRLREVAGARQPQGEMEIGQTIQLPSGAVAYYAGGDPDDVSNYVHEDDIPRFGE